ncbi:hypothetical protein ACFLQX_00100 [Bacteroidota bacterium]
MNLDIMTTNKIYKMKRENLPTLLAIAALSWIFVNISHETIGHAGFGLLSGLKLNAVNTTTAFLDVNWDNEINLNGFTKYRLFLIGGVFMNFLTGLIAYLILKYKSGLNTQMRLFLWLFASFSYVIIVMNLISVPIIGGGDLVGIIRTYDNQELARTIVLIVGFVFMIVGYLALQKGYMPEIKKHRSVLLSIVGIPVVTVIVLQTLSLINSPFSYLSASQSHLLASVFAYFHFILWAIVVYIVPASNKKYSIEDLLPNKSVKWIVAGVVTSVFYIFILGSGLGSFDGHPSLQ